MGCPYILDQLIGWDQRRLAVAPRYYRTPIPTMLLHDFDEGTIEPAFGEQFHRNTVGEWKGLGIHSFSLKSSAIFSKPLGLKTA
jgi:hypothetical protein